MEHTDRPYTFDRVVRMALSAGVLVATLLLLRYLSDVLIPFVLAVILAYFLNPLVTLFEEKTKRRWAAVAITLGGLATVGIALMAIVVVLGSSQVGRFADDLGKLRADLTASAVLDGVEGPAPAPPTDPAENDPNQEPDSEAGEGGRALPGSSWPIGLRELQAALAEFRDHPGDRPREVRFSLLRQRVAGTVVGRVLESGVSYLESEEFDTWLVGMGKRVAAGGVSVLSFGVQVILVVTALIIVLIYLAFILLDYPAYTANWRSFLPPSYRENIVEFLSEFDFVLRRHFRGQFIVASLTGLLFVIGFSIIGLPMALPLGVFLGVLNMVPYLQAVGLVPAAMLAVLMAIEGNSSITWALAAVGIVFVLVQVVQDFVITPKVMGEMTGLKPAAILLGVFVWGKLLGFLGILLAIPLTCLGIAYYRRYVLMHAPEETRLASG